MTFLKNYTCLVALFLVFFMTACEDDSNEPMTNTTNYGSGIYVVNEGAFNGGTGTISFYDRNTNMVTQDIFTTANAGLPLGNIAQSMIKHNDKAYIVVNNANKIEVTDGRSFEMITTIEGLGLPRHILPISNTEAYVSQWGTGTDGSIAIVDLTSNTVSNTLAPGSGPGELLRTDDKVYVAYGGGFGRDSMLVRIDVASQATETFVVGDNPKGLQVDVNGAVWVLSSGYTDFYDAANNTEGALHRIDENGLVQVLQLPNGAGNLEINPAGDLLYFTANGKVYRHAINELAFDEAMPLIDRSFYAIGVDSNGNILGADAKDFVANGEVVIYDSEGVELNTFVVGVIPTDFWVE